MDILIEELEGSLWAAALQNGKVQGLEVDPAIEEIRYGSVYLAKVKTIDAALDAVFLDLDGDNTGILYNKDTRFPGKDGTFQKGGEKAISKQFSPGDLVAVQAKNSYMPVEASADSSSERKIPEMSMDITMPGRYLIYTPMSVENRISVRIRDKTMRKNLRAMIQDLGDMQGFILRAAAANTQTDVLRRECKILKTAWEQMRPYIEGQEFGLIMEGPDAIQRTLSDHSDKVIDTIEVVIMDHYEYVENWASIFAPDLVTKVSPIELDNAEDDLALFHYRDIIGQIEDLFQSYVFLPGGGNIIIQKTAALIAIDINKSSSKQSNISINLEAAVEIARQIKLRNLGGMIIIDFLNFKNRKEEGQLIAALEEETLKDPCTVQIHGRSNLGLIEISRKRRTPPLQEKFSGIFE